MVFFNIFKNIRLFMVMNPLIFANVREYMQGHMLFIFLMTDLRG